MAAAFGLHFGSTTTSIALFKDGSTEVLANDAGDRTTPAIVACDEHGTVIGLPAKQGMIRNSVNTVCYARRALGISSQDDDFSTLQSLCSTTAPISAEDGIIKYTTPTNTKKPITPHFCVTEIFKFLRGIAQHHGDGDVRDVVLSVPSCYTQTQSDALVKSATDAGFSVLRLNTEPAAALLCYDIGRTNHHDSLTVVVIRIGGVSSTISVVAVNNGLFSVLLDKETTEVNGSLLTDMVTQHFASEFTRKTKMDPRENRRSMAKLRTNSEAVKHILTMSTAANCNIDSLHEGLDLSSSLPRMRLETMAIPLLSKLQALIESSLEQCQLSKYHISDIILAGGGTKPPCISKKIQEVLPEATLHNSIPADEVICIGAAKQAGLLLNSIRDNINNPTCDLSCLTQEIGITAEGSEYQTVFNARQPTPMKAKRVLICNQSPFKMLVSNGPASQETILAKVRIDDIPENAEIEVHLGLEGGLHISCFCAKTEKKVDLTVPFETS